MTPTKLIKALLIGASQFLRGTRAGATAISAAAVIIMTIGGTALISDHLWLVNNRDILKTAADAGAVAATMRLRRFPNSTQEELQAITERYIWINLKSNINDPSLKQSDVRTVLNLNRTMGLVVSGCVKARISGEQGIRHPAICGAGDDSERWVSI